MRTVRDREIAEEPLCPLHSTFPHTYGAITIETEATISVDLSEKAKETIVIPQAGSGRIQGEMIQRARFSKRTAALYAQLAHSQDQMLAELIAALDHENAWVRSGAAEALGEIGSERSVTDLKRVSVNDPDPNVRTTAEEALEKIRKPAH